ncbi:sensor histidine kinase [Nafulsella turpanensis]|uniref:sensor histidine kinase n=1 Tax=Nafulsella turpanensis TaxID=1265690 RepID=UPI00034B2B1C|nr:ATP-binding protein [Nafulsella turpanensis]
MNFKDFRFSLLARVLLLVFAIFLCVYEVVSASNYLTGLIIFCLVVYLVYNLYEFVLSTNHKLTRFLEGIRYSDFTSNVNADNQLGESFADLNLAFNQVMEAFRRTRAEKEEHLQYLNTLVQHVQVGLISYDPDGNIELINNVARRFLNVTHIKNIKQLQYANPEMYRLLKELPEGGKHLLRQSSEFQLSINATALVLHNRTYRLLSFQNIKSELQDKEIEAWQNLSRVLRHEIMNSITPMTSLAATLTEILEEDVKEKDGHFELEAESVEDIKEGLQTIQNRSEGLRRFVDAYRSFTSIPQPKMQLLQVKELFYGTLKLMQPDIRSKKIKMDCQILPDDLQLYADPQLLEMVLINLIKNAVEALNGKEGGQVWLKAEADEHQRVLISLRDNGPGIEPEALSKIFIPFYTTKPTGSGIGLSLSREILQMHQAQLTVESFPEQGSCFFIRFS